MKKSVVVALATSVALAGLAAPAFALEGGDWLFKVGLTNIDPKQDNGNLGADQITVGDDTQVSFTGEYLFTSNLGLELLASLPFDHDVYLEGEKVANAKHLPPTLSLNWHFNPAGDFIPYVGAGVNYTTFFDEDTYGSLGAVDVELDDSWGVALQAGVDYMIRDNTSINFAVRWIDIDAEIVADGAGTGIDAEIDPWLITLALGYQF